MILLDEKGLHAILRCAKIIFLEIDTYYESSPPYLLSMFFDV